jgi:hypothetical protein
MKKSFALFITILLILIFSTISISIIEVKQMDRNIDIYKYFHLQSMLHLEYVEEYILKHKKPPNWSNQNERYSLEVKSDDNITFDIFISPLEDINVRVHKQVVLK